MSRCLKCGFENKSGKFCIKCGTQLPSSSPEIIAQIEILRKKIDLDALNPKLYFDLANLFFENNMDSEALLEFQKVVNLESNNIEAYRKSAILYTKLHQPEKAETSYRKVLALSQTDNEAKKGLYDVLCSLKKFEEAILLAQEFIQRDPSNRTLHLNLKWLLDNTGSKADALHELEIILSLAPDDLNTLKELALRYESQGHATKLLECYQRIIAIDPLDENALLFLGRYYCYNHEYTTCVALLSKNKNLTSHTHLYLTYSYLRQDLFESALSEFNLIQQYEIEEASDNDKTLYAEILFFIGNQEVKNHHSEAARTYYTKALFFAAEQQEYKNALQKMQELEQQKQAASQKKLYLYTIVGVITIMIGFGIWYFQHGQIMIHLSNCTNSQLQLYVDNTLVDNKANEPLLIKSPFIKAGEHYLKIKKYGFSEWSKTISIGHGSTIEEEIKLDTIFKMVSFNIIPNGAKIYINDKFFGFSPLQNTKLPVGKYKVDVTARYFDSYSGSLFVDELDINGTTVTLKRGKGKLRLIYTESEYYTCSVMGYGASIENWGGWFDIEAYAGAVLEIKYWIFVHSFEQGGIKKYAILEKGDSKEINLSNSLPHTKEDLKQYYHLTEEEWNGLIIDYTK